MFNKRLQILLDDKEYKKVKEISRKTHKSVGEIFRDAVAMYGEYIASRSDRKKIVSELFSLELPVSSWPQMKKKIIQAHLG